MRNLMSWVAAKNPEYIPNRAKPLAPMELGGMAMVSSLYLGPHEIDVDAGHYYKKETPHLYLSLV